MTDSIRGTSEQAADAFNVGHPVEGREWVGQSSRRHLGLIKPGLVEAVSHLDLLRALESPAVSFGRYGSAVALTSVLEDRWLSDRLGIRMGRIAPVVVDGLGDACYRAARSALAAAVEAAAADGFDLLALRIAHRDVLTFSVAASNGFEVVGVEDAYLIPAAQPVDIAGLSTSTPRSPISAEVVAGGDPLDVNYEDAWALLDRAGRFRLSHLGKSSKLVPSAVANVYRAWTGAVLDGSYGDVVAIARLDDRVVGIFAWVRDRFLSDAHGVEVLGGSWGVVSEQGRGALTAMVSALVSAPSGRERWLECETQVDNSAMNAVMKRVAAGRPTRCLVLHKAVGSG